MAMDLLKFAHEVKWRDMSRSVCTGWLRSLSLPQHLLLLALTPLPFLLAAFFMVHEVEPKASHEPARLARGVAAVRLLATAVEAGVYFRRPQQLEQFVDALGGADNVSALAIYDHSGRPLVERGRAAVATRERVRAVRTASFIDERGGRMAFAAPVMSMPAARDDGIGDALFTLVEPRAAGWVLLEIDAPVPVSAGDQLFLRHALLTLAALAGSIYVALRLGHACRNDTSRAGSRNSKGSSCPFPAAHSEDNRFCFSNDHARFMACLHLMIRCHVNDRRIRHIRDLPFFHFLDKTGCIFRTA